MSGIPRRPADRVLNPPAELPAAGGKRRIDAAIVDRLTAAWVTSRSSLDHELRTSLDLTRTRSRDLFVNNEYATKFGSMVASNVVGPEGFVLQSRPADPDGSVDRVAARAVEAAWWRWMRPANCDITGRRSFVALCQAGILSVARDGELLWRKVRGRGAGPFGLQLQPIDVDRLDTNYNLAAVAGRNAIIMGVEVTDYGKPVAYHIWTAHPSDALSDRKRERVLAEDMIHLFLHQREGQTRGIPWMAPVMRRIHDLEAYRHAAVVAARQGASKMGFYVSPDGNPADLGEDSDGKFAREASPGTFDVLPSGYDFKSYDPTYPHDQFDSFCKEALRGISSGLRVAYPSLGNDLTGVNFSSIRSGVLEERDYWMGVQAWMISSLLEPLFDEWLELALLREAIVLPSGRPLPLARFEKFSAHVWQPRRWSWVDPKKDMEAAILAINARLASPQQIAAQQGRDIEDVLDDIAQFEQMLSARGISMPEQGRPPPAPPPEDDEDRTRKLADLQATRSMIDALRDLAQRPVNLQVQPPQT